MKKKLSGNTGRVLEYMKTHKGITSMQAFQLFGATRLSAIIFNLRNYGYSITSEPKQGKNRYKESVHFVEYKLNKEKR